MIENKPDFIGEIGNTKENEAMEIMTVEDLVEFYRAYYRNSGVRYSRENDPTIHDAEQVFRARQEGEEVYFFGIKDENRVIATCILEVMESKEGEKYGDVGFVSMDKNQRGKDLIGRVLDKMEKSAREKGCLFVELEVLNKNYSAITAYFKSDYNIINTSGLGFIMHKDFRDRNESERKNLGELKEISMNRMRKINELLRDDWRGIDIKNIKSTKSQNPNDWKLILEKNN